jgi:transcriptional regulator NrdR family protein
MVCIYCGKDTEVYNSRVKSRNPSIWRRRRCLECVAQFTTIELPDYGTSLVVEGLSGKLSPFNRDKLFLSFYKALEYRQDALKSATELTSTVIGRLLTNKKATDGLLNKNDVALESYRALKRFDALSAHTYKAYHQSSLTKK